ncbi:PAS domain-containing protein [Qipengyuania zhejiangensis]|uniref:PAS domain-containing protein n=1 Tax=Qipengyuania zhejiangensis TaxID=3077782 RepID=UPI003EB7B0F8
MDRLGGYFGTHDAEDPIDDFVDEGTTDNDPPPSPVGQDERRMQVRAYNHWASLLGDLNFPHIDDLEPQTLDDFGPYSVLLDFADGIEDPVVRFVGSELAVECGEHDGISTLSDVPTRSVLSRITDHYMQIIANQAPIGFEAEFVNERGATVLYRGILLPYSSDNTTIDFIYGVINWKEMADQQTADELLLEIGQSLGEYDDDTDETDSDGLETAETLTAADEPADEPDDDVLDLGIAEIVDASDEDALPEPAFGQPAEPDVSVQKPTRSVDALGNPIGGFAASDDYGDYDDTDFGSGDFDSGIKTAADYGLPEWDEDPEGDDVEDLVDPLADEEVSSSLISLVSRGERVKKSVNLSRPETGEDDEDFPAIPQAYEAADAQYDVAAEPDGPQEPEATFAENEYDGFETEAPEDHSLEVEALDVSDEAAPVVPEVRAPATETAFEVDDADDAVPAIDAEAPEGLYDCLAAARELAQTAQNTEDRSRKALYAAVGHAYDFSLEAEDDRDGFDELLSDNGLTIQDRAPMTPVVKLVFGADYDKTRLTEYAAVLMHAHRIGVERGSLARFLHEAEGGLKGVVNAERRARKEEQGKEVEDENCVRSALARKLRKIEPVELDDLAAEGPEFALVMVRRTPEGDLVVLGEVPDDVSLVERAARKLLG